MSYEVLVVTGIAGPPGGDTPVFDTKQELQAVIDMMTTEEPAKRVSGFTK